MSDKEPIDVFAKFRVKLPSDDFRSWRKTVTLPYGDTEADDVRDQIVWKAAIAQADAAYKEEIEKLRADNDKRFDAESKALMQLADAKLCIEQMREALLKVRSSDERTENYKMITEAISLTPSLSALYEQDAEKLLPLQRQVAMLCSVLERYQGQYDRYGKYHPAYEAVHQTQATAETYDREHAAKVLEEAAVKLREAGLAYAVGFYTIEHLQGMARELRNGKKL